MIARTYAAELVCAFFLCFFSTNSSADLASAIAECNAIATSEEGSSDDLLAGDCPGLIIEIELSPWSETLAPGWREDLSYWELSQLDYFVSYYSQQDSGIGDISLSPLDEIVSGLGDDPREKVNESLWDRFKNWLSNLLGEETAYSSGWFSDWLSNFRVSTLAIKFIFWTVSAVIVVAAIIVIVTEIRVARKSLPVRVEKSQKRKLGNVMLVDHQILALKDLEDADPIDKPSILLRLFIQRLQSLGIASYNPGCTHREASDAASELLDDEIDVLFRVSDSAERIRFGHKQNVQFEISQIVSAGITLLNDLKPKQA